MATFVLAGGLAFGVAAAPAAALNPARTLCSAAGVLTAGVNPCGVAKKAGGGLVSVGKKLITGHPGAAVGAAAGAVGSSVVSIGLTAIGAWVLGGAKFALGETSKVLGSTTSPQLRSTWFSGTYWRMAGISAVLTLPFLFAAAIQALLRADLSLLARAAFMHLPLSLLVVSIAAPLTMLLLAASDELSAIVSGAAGNESSHFLNAAALTVGGLSALGSPFLAFLIGVFTVAGAIVLWIELLMRETAVYVIVLMLPLAFAAFVWPARRIWAVRALELLGALILSKFAIVAVLSLGGAALGSALGHPSVAKWLAGLVLVLMAAFMPWALLRLVPLAEVAGSAAGPLRRELSHATGAAKAADVLARGSDDWLGTITGRMRSQAGEAWDAGEGPRSARVRRVGQVEPADTKDADVPADAEPRDATTGQAPGPASVGDGADAGAAGAADPTPEVGVGDAADPTPEASTADAADPTPEPSAAGAADPTPEPARRATPADGGATASFNDSELFTAAAQTRRLDYGVSGQPSFVIESDRGTGGRAATTGRDPAASDEFDPLAPAQEDPEGAL